MRMMSLGLESVWEGRKMTEVSDLEDADDEINTRCQWLNVDGWVILKIVDDEVNTWNQ